MGVDGCGWWWVGDGDSLADPSLISLEEPNGGCFSVCRLTSLWKQCELPQKRVWDTALTEADAFNGLHLYVCMDGWLYYVFMYVSLETSVCGDSGYGFVVCLLIINSCGLSTQTTAAS